MASISNNSQSLSRLFQQAKITSKGFQINDAMTDASKKIKLKPDEVQDLLATVEKLPAAEKSKAVDVLSFFRDKFEIADPTALKLFEDAVPAATPVKSGALPRSVATQQAKALTKPTQVSAKDIQRTDAAIDGAENAGGKVLGDGAAAAVDQTFKDNDAKVHPEAQKARTKSVAKRQAASSDEAPAAPPAAPPAASNPTMALFEQYAKSPFFEDRLMAALGKAGLKFMTDMNQKLASFDDPQREAQLRQIAKDDMAGMLKMANTLSPDAKSRVAQQIADFAKQGGKVADPQLQAFIDSAGKPGADGKTPSPDDIMKAMPSSDNPIVKAMASSADPSVRGWGAVIQASDSAEQLKGMLANRDPMKMSEDDLRAIVAKGHEFQAEVHGLQSSLPEDVKQQIGEVKIDDLPAAIDPTSRQVMFQQINLMMNQYQQIMQAFSEIINKLNEMAMDPIRKIGR